jgi:hypothetical protein
MGCNTSSEQQLWLQENRREFVDGQPESLKAIVHQFFKEDGTYDYNLLIWTSKNSFVRVGYDVRQEFPRVYRDYRLGLWLTRRNSHHPSLYIHSRTLEDAIACLKLLVGLHDDHFEKMEIFQRHVDTDDPLQLCPLSSVLLEKVLQQNAKRKHVFCDMTFTPDQCRTLATSGTRTDIELTRSKFEDDGEAFLEALEARADPQTGLAELTIRGRLPFAEGILVLFLHMLKCLTLYRIRLESEEACRAVAAAELQYLELYHCKLADGGAALVESIRVGRGPKGLDLYNSRYYGTWQPFDSPFDSFERFVSFLNALRGNSHLKRLDLSNFDLREEGILDALAAALFENKGLCHLGLSECRLNKSCFCEFLRAILAHSSLHTLYLTSSDLDMKAPEASEEFAKMLSDNDQLEEIRIYKHGNDSAAWDKLVIPRLECNVYRKRFPAIQEIRPLSTRAAVLASTLAHVSNKPSPAFMLLRQNVDILASYHDEASNL